MVFKARPVRERFDEVTQKTDNCWIWKGPGAAGGYGALCFTDRNPSKPSRVRAHRLSYELNVGPIPDGLLVLHKCDNRLCVRPDHLFLGTQADNVHDMCRKGRYRLGKRYNQKLSDDDIAAIRASSESQKILAMRYNVCPSHISKIKGRKARNGRDNS